MLRLLFCLGKDNNYTFEDLKQELFMNDYSQVILCINNYIQIKNIKIINPYRSGLISHITYIDIYILYVGLSVRLQKAEM